MFGCPSFLPATSNAPAPTGLGEAAESLLMAAVPEFLGGLGAALVIALATAMVRRLRRRTTTPHETDGTE